MCNGNDSLVAVITNSIGPLVICSSRSAMMSHEVESRRAAEALALRHVKATAVCARLRLRDEAPVHRWERIDRARADAEKGSRGRGPEDGLAELIEDARLDDGDGEACLGETYSYGVTSSSSTNDDIVEAGKVCCVSLWFFLHLYAFFVYMVDRCRGKVIIGGEDAE